MTMQTEQSALILASSSPRRRALLAEAGYQFEPVDPPIEEPPAGRLPLAPQAQAEALAYFKARSVADIRPHACVLGADTICAGDGRILGKPADAEDARRMLRLLSSTPHQVITGVAVVGPGVRRRIASDVTWVRMRPMTEAELDAYVASGEWVGKAGAYAIQETADRFVLSLDGSFTNVVGLPMELLERLLCEEHRRAAG